MTLLFLALFAVAPTSAQFPLVQSDSAVDSLAILLAEPSLDSILASHGDSLFLPKPGFSRIIRDQYGVPHIYGATDVDVAFGFGYAQAQDHLLQMMLSYRMSKGQASEILGEDLLESDYKSLLWRIDRIAGEQFGALPQRTRDFIGGFVDGVNHYIALHRQVIPGWIEPVRGTDIVSLSRWMTLLFAEKNGAAELKAKGLSGPEVPATGSNQIAIGSSRSASGFPLLMMDPHVPWQLPTLWYEAHLVSGEGLDVYGAAAYGSPVISFGHNQKLAWSFTVNDADIFDLYEEKLDPANPRRYLYEGEKQRMSSRRAKIRVRTEAGVTEVTRELLYSHHGPIYKLMDDWAYAAKTPLDDLFDAVGQAYEMNRAQNLQEFRLALARLQIPMFNVMYADAEGNLYYAFLAKSAIRSEKFDWRAPLPGWTEESEWRGFLPFSQLPQLLNPPAGFMQNCNIPPDAVTVGSSLERTNFPSYLGWGEMNDRGRRALSWLASRETVTVEDLISFSRDTYLLPAEELKGLVLRAYNRTWRELYDPDSRIAKAINLLRDWDNRASVDSRATLLFATWKARFDPLIEQLPAVQRADVGVLEKLALEALQGAVAFIDAKHGRLDVRWGDVHAIKRGDVRYPVGGSPRGTHALHDTWSKEADDGVREVWGGSSFTCVVELGPTPRAWTLLPYGNSEDPESAHFADQAPLQSADRLKRAWYSDEDVYLNTTSVLTVPFGKDESKLVSLRAWWKQRQRVLSRRSSLNEADSVSSPPPRNSF